MPYHFIFLPGALYGTRYVSSVILYLHYFMTSCHSPCRIVIVFSGKTIQTIALIHCLLTHPALTKVSADGVNTPKSKRIFRRVLVVVPINVLVNWQSEMSKWVNELDVPKVRTYTLNDMAGKASTRDLDIKKNWVDRGGILFTSDHTLARFLKPLINKKEMSALRHEAFLSPGPDGTSHTEFSCL